MKARGRYPAKTLVDSTHRKRMMPGPRAGWILILLIVGCLLASGTALCSEVEIPLPEGAVARLGLGWIRDVAYSPDGRYLAVGTSIGIELRDAGSLTLVRFFRGHTRHVLAIAFSPDGRTLASGSGDRTIRLWDVETGQELRILTGHTGPVSSVAFTPDGRRLASGSHDNTIKVWNVGSGKLLHNLTDHTSRVLSVAFSPDGRILAGSCYNSYGTITLWGVERGDLVSILHHIGGVYSFIRSVAFSPDGRFLASGSSDTTAKLWDVATWEELRTFYHHGRSVESVVFSPDGRTLAVSSHDVHTRGDAKITLWSVETGNLLCNLDYTTECSVAFSPDGRTLASGHFETIKTWNVATGEELGTLTRQAASVFSVAFSPDGRLLASGSGDRTVKLWDAATEKELRTLAGHTRCVNMVAFSPDGKTLASASDDETIRVWDIESGQELHTLTGHTEYVTSVAFSSDGRSLASGSDDQTIRVWDIESGQELRTLTGHTEDITSVAFSPDGRTLAVSYSTSYISDGTATLWDVETGNVLFTLNHTRSIYSFVCSVAFSPDGSRLASGSDDTTVKVWDVATGEELRTLTGHTGSVNLVAFSPDGKILASCSNDDTIMLWDVENGEDLRTFVGHTGSVQSVAFSTDGRALASGSSDGTMLLWDMTSLFAQPSEIASIDFPQSTLTGVETTGAIGFHDHDPDGALSEARFHILEGDLEDFTLNLTAPPYCEHVEGLTEGSFGFEITVDQPGSYRVQVTLVNESGMDSEPLEFFFDAISPTPPTVSSVAFPAVVAVDRAQYGLVKFEDPDGDIVQTEFEILEGDPSTIEIEPATSFDPEVSGRTEGAFRFSVQATQAQTVRLRLTLTDSKGLVSEPHEFTFKVE